MIFIPDSIRSFTILSVSLRILFTCASAGLIGFERGREGRAAGLRTHMLVALGACLVMSANQYLLITANPNADPARLGAQVINGIGFLGAGTILATGKRVTGLTTAAGLWTTACVGLAYGCGYFEGALLVTIVMFFALTLLHTFEGYTPTYVAMEILVEIEKTKYIPGLIEIIKTLGLRISNISITDTIDPASKGHLDVRLSLSVGRNYDSSTLLEELTLRMPIIRFEEL